MTTSRPKNLLWHGAAFLAYGLIVLSLIFNVWSVEKLLSRDSTLEWPHTLHVWLIQIGAFVFGGIGLILLARRERLAHWLEAQSASQQASLLFWLLVGIQVLLGMAFMVTKQHPGFSDWGYLYSLFNVNQEFSIPTLYEVGLFWLAAALAALNAYRTARHGSAGPRPPLTWAATAFTLLVMGLDELLSLHEQTGQLAGAAGQAIEGYGYAWTVVAFPVAAILGAFFLAQFRRIFADRPGQLVMLVMAGAIFIGGAVFVENFHLYLQKQHGLPETLSVYHLLEEMGEMLGITLAIRVFYQHARELLP